MPASSTRDRVALVALVARRRGRRSRGRAVQGVRSRPLLRPEGARAARRRGRRGALARVSARRRVTLTAVDWLLGGFLVASSVVSAAFATNLWLAERAVAISLSGAAAVLGGGRAPPRRAARDRCSSRSRRASSSRAGDVARAGVWRADGVFQPQSRAGRHVRQPQLHRALAAIGTPVVVLVALTARRGLGSRARRRRHGGARARRSCCRAAARRGSPCSRSAVVTGALAFADARSAGASRRRCGGSGCWRRAVVAGVVAAVALPEPLEWKSDSPYLDSATGLVNYKEGSGRGRLVQYSNSLRHDRGASAARRRTGQLAGGLPEVRVAQRSVDVAGRRADVQSVAEQRLGRVPVGARRDRGSGCSLAAMLGAVRARRSAICGAGERAIGERVLTAIALVGTLAATAVVGAFDAVLLLAAPTFLVWTLAGALAPPPARGAARSATCVVWGTVVVLVVGRRRGGRGARRSSRRWPHSARARASRRSRRGASRSGELSAPSASRAGVSLARRLCARPGRGAGGARALSERGRAAASARRPAAVGREPSRVENIVERGARRRRVIGGVAALVVAIAALLRS